MTITVVPEGTSTRVQMDFLIPNSQLQLPPKKRGMFEQADIDWGFKKPEPPQPLGDPNPQPYGVIKVSALKYVKTLIDQEIRTAGGQP
jgi:hypothetical protein